MTDAPDASTHAPAPATAPTPIPGASTHAAPPVSAVDAAAAKAKAASDEAAANAAHAKAHQKTLGQALVEAHDNLMKELAGLAQAAAAGQPITVAQIGALQATGRGLWDVINVLGKSHGLDMPITTPETIHTPGTAGRALRS
jgi:hypothetical protein